MSPIPDWLKAIATEAVDIGLAAVIPAPVASPVAQPTIPVVMPAPTTTPPPPFVQPPVPAGSVEAAALAEATRAGMTSPSTVSDNAMPSMDEMHLRIQALEALVTHIFESHFRGTNLSTIVENWFARSAGSKVLDETVKGRP